MEKRVNYLANKGKLLSDFYKTQENDTTKSFVPFDLPIRATMAGLTVTSLLDSTQNVTLSEDGKKMYLDFNPLSMGTCSKNIYKKLKNYKHQNKIDIRKEDTLFEFLMD